MGQDTLGAAASAARTDGRHQIEWRRRIGPDHRARMTQRAEGLGTARLLQSIRQDGQAERVEGGVYGALVALRAVCLVPASVIPGVALAVTLRALSLSL